MSGAPSDARPVADSGDGSPPPELLAVRAAWRRWIAERGWGPLVWLDPRWAPDTTAVKRAAAQARDGWLYLGPGSVSSGLEQRARTATEEAGARLVLEASAPAGRLARLRWEEHHHLVASDPSLQRQRAALLAHCQHGEVVLLVGPPGCGRRSLARWAHGQLGTARMVEVEREGAAVHARDRWMLVADPGEDHTGLLRSLLARVERSAPPPPPVVGEGQRPDHPAFATLVGRDPALCAALRRALVHAPHDYPVLVLGETGTGKELLAKALHQASGRRGELVAIDLGTLSPEMAASTLFGHERGAFTGASRPRKGAFRRAHGGTLFLDELGNLSLELQARLLRVLETGEVRPLGADRTERVDVRVVAATNRDPELLVQEGRFRRDLLHRLDTVVLRLPPLRERLGDLPLLAERILDELGGEELTEPALCALQGRSWPGNVRQLRNELRAAVVEAAGGPVRVEHLGGAGRACSSAAPAIVTTTEPALERTALDRGERQIIGALTLRVPALGQRGSRCVRNTVLAGLGGRAITDPALILLEAWPWWGHLVELHRKLATLRREAGGVIDRDSIVRLFPDMAATPSHAPICVLLEPVVRPDGSVRGFRSDHHTAGVVVGRARRLGREGADPRMAWLRQQLPEGEVELLTVPHIAELSRLHLVLSREARGLVVRHFPGTRLEVRASPVGVAPAPLAAGSHRSLGEAGQIEISRDPATPMLRLLVFLGAQAMAGAAEQLRKLSWQQTARPTLHGATRTRQRIWVLDEHEVDLLVDLILDTVHRDEDLAPSLRRELRKERPHVARLRAYVDSSNPTQSVGRLFEHAGNQALRRRLNQELGRRGLDAAALPTRVRRSLQG